MTLYIVNYLLSGKIETSQKYFIYSGLNKLEPEEITAFKANRDLISSFSTKLEKEEMKNLTELTNVEIDNFICEPLENKERIVANEYKNFFHRYQYSLGHYFRNLYHIYKYIYITKLISEQDKQFYANIVRAQLSTDELVLIFYNCLTPVNYYSNHPNLGYPKFKYLIDKFDIIQNMNDRLLLDKKHLEIFNNNNVNQTPSSFLNLTNEI